MPRLSHHHLGHLVLHHERGQAVEVGLVLGPLHRLQRAGQRPGGVGQRDAPPAGADVDAHHPAAAPAPRRHLQPGRQPLGQVDLGGLVGDRREPPRQGDLAGRVVRRLPGRGARPGGRDLGQVTPPLADRAGVLRVVLRHDSYLPTAAATASSPAFSAAGIPAGSVPPPWATSGLPPPPPPTCGAAVLISSPAEMPRSTAAGLSAATSATFPPASETSRTTAGRSVPRRARTSRARVRRSPPARPSGAPVTTCTPPTSVACCASVPAAATLCWARSSASSLSTSRSRASMPLTRSTRPSVGVLSRSPSWRTRSRSRARERNPSSPTTASTRRDPEPTEDSPVSASGPIWALPRTWVPPQSSRDQGPPISTTRTCSP